MFHVGSIKENISAEFQDLDSQIDLDIASLDGDMARNGSHGTNVHIGGLEEQLINDLDKRVQCVQKQLENIVAISEPQMVQLSIKEVNDCLTEILSAYIEKAKQTLHRKIQSFPYSIDSKKSQLTYEDRAARLIKKRGQEILYILLKKQSEIKNEAKNIQLAEEANSIAKSSKRISY